MTEAVSTRIPARDGIPEPAATEDRVGLLYTGLPAVSGAARPPELRVLRQKFFGLRTNAGTSSEAWRCGCSVRLRGGARRGDAVVVGMRSAWISATRRCASNADLRALTSRTLSTGRFIDAIPIRMVLEHVHDPASCSRFDAPNPAGGSASLCRISRQGLRGVRAGVVPVAPPVAPAALHPRHASPRGDSVWLHGGYSGDEGPHPLDGLLGGPGEGSPPAVVGAGATSAIFPQCTDELDRTAGSR